MNAHRSPRSRRLGLVAGLAIAALAFTGCSSDTDDSAEAADQTTTVRVATSVSNSFPFVAVQAAERLGTFAEAGIEVEVVEATTPTIGQVMAGGEADIALAAANSEAANIILGLPATIVASNLSYWDQRIIARPGISSVEELKGANFGITGGGSPGEYSVVKLAEKLGWEDSDYTVTSVGNLQALTAALSAGTIDAFAWNSQAAFQVELAGEGTIVADGADFVGDNVQQAFAVMDEFAAANPDTVRTFFEAYFAAVEALQADPQAFIDVLVEDWDIAPEVAERLATESLPHVSADGVITDSELAGLADATEFTLDDGTEVDAVAYTFWKDLG